MGQREEAKRRQHGSATGGHVGVEREGQANDGAYDPGYDCRGHCGPQTTRKTQPNHHRHYEHRPDQEHAHDPHRQRDGRAGQNRQPEVERAGWYAVNFRQIVVKGDLRQVDKENAHEQQDRHGEPGEEPQVQRRNAEDRTEEEREEVDIEASGETDDDDGEGERAVQHHGHGHVARQPAARAKLLDSYGPQR